MFMQGTPPPPPFRPPRPRPFQRPITPDAQRLRLLLQIVDARTQAECLVRDLLQLTTTVAIQAASLLQQALYNAYIRVERSLKTTTNDFISNIDAPNRFQRFMGGATSLLHDNSATKEKFKALESELTMLKEQMAILLQGQAVVRSASAESPCPAVALVPIPPPAPPCPALSSRPDSFCTTQTMSLLDDLICSDLSDSEGDDSDHELGYGIRGEGMPPCPPLRPSRSTSPRSAKTRIQRRPTFAEQIQQRNRAGLRKTRIDRSPGGTPLKSNSIPGCDDGFHQEILANALFRKFQNVRGDESPERRPARKKFEQKDSLVDNNGLAALLEGEVQDDEWSDK